MTIGGVPLPVSIWKGVRVLVEPANVIIINGDDSTTGLPRARREGDEQTEQTYDKCVSHNYGARKIIDEDEDNDLLRLLVLLESSPIVILPSDSRSF